MHTPSRQNEFGQDRRVGLWRDTQGTVTIFAVVAFGLLIAVIGLIMDISRVMNVHSQANAYADRVALASATELDRRSNALARAIDAAQGEHAQIDPGFRLTLSGDDTIGVAKLTFLADLGPDPADPYARSPVAGDTVTATWTPGGGLTYETGITAADAARLTEFVVVDTTTETENYLFMPIMAAFAPGMATEASVAPQAVAGFNREVCNAPPLMMCNINEATAGAGAPFAAVPGQMIRTKMQGAGGGWAPGAFGLLDAPGGTGASAVREYVARRDPNTFCVRDSVDVKPGQNTGPISQGMNVRFDIYDGPMSGSKNNAQYAPAGNVTKGQRKTGNGNNCNFSKSGTSTPLPRDNCFMPSGSWPNGIPSGSGTGCTTYGGVPRAGDGSWNRAGYWATNHSGQAQPPGYGTMTRYQVYRYELENTPPGLVNTAEESGAPMCSSSTPISDAANDRRVLPVAIVNCIENQALLGGNAQDVPVEEYVDVFLTEPVGNTAWWNASVDDIFVEVISVVRPNQRNSVLREYPVLYR
jgi:Flp pilus assembly protein TadG